MINERNSIVALFIILSITASIINYPLTHSVLQPTKSFPGRISNYSGYTCKGNCTVIAEAGYHRYVYIITYERTGTASFNLYVYDLVSKSILSSVNLLRTTLSEGEQIYKYLKTGVSFYSLSKIDVVLISLKTLGQTRIIFNASFKPDIRIIDEYITSVLDLGVIGVVKTPTSTYLISRSSIVNTALSRTTKIIGGVDLGDRCLLLIHDALSNKYSLLEVLYNTLSITNNYPLITGSTTIYDMIGLINNHLVVSIAGRIIVYVLSITNNALSINKLNEITLTRNTLSRPYVVSDRILVPIVYNNSLIFELYDQGLNLIDRKIIYQWTSKSTIRFWRGLNDKYVIAWLRDPKDSIVFVYPGTGNLRIIDKSPTSAIIYVKPIWSATAILFINVTVDKITNEKNYYLHVKTIDGSYDRNLAKDIFFTGKEPSIIVLNSPSSTTITYRVIVEKMISVTKTIREMRYRVVVISNLGVLINRGIIVNIYVNQGNKLFVYARVKDGQPISIPSGKVYVRLVSAIGYTGVEDNYDPIPLNIPLHGVVELNSTKYNAGIIINGGYAEITFKPDNGIPFVIVHSGGIAEYYIPPGHYEVTVRYANGVVGRGELTVYGGEVISIDLKDFMPKPTIIDILINNLIPIILILITIASITVLIVAVLTLRSEEE